MSCDSLISVVIPTYHRNGSLAECLSRLAPASQGLPVDEYEVIVTDDGTETTAELLIREHFPWVKWVKGPGKGPAANRNNGARYAAGEWIAFTDDDCLPTSQWISELAASAISNVDVVEGKTICPQGLRTPLDEAPVNLAGGRMWSCNIMIRAAVFRQLGGFDEDFPAAWCEDVEFSGRIRRGGFVHRFASDAVVEHPVRRRKAGWGAGPRWESRVLLWFKEGHKESTWSWLPMHLVKVRLSQILEFPASFDSFLAFCSIPLELCYVVLGLNSWERKYRPMARG